MRALSVALSLLVAGCALTQVEQERYHFACDVPAGRGSEWSRTLGAKRVEVVGSVTLLEPRASTRWRPVANIYLAGDANTRVGLRLILDPRNEDQLQLVMSGPDKATERIPVAEMPWRSKRIDFTVALSRSGLLTVSAGGTEKSLQLDDFQIRGLVLSCSSGEFEFTDVALANT